MSARDLVPSVSVENMVNQRAAVLERIGQAVTLLNEAAGIAAAGHIGMPRFLVATGYGRHHNTELEVVNARFWPGRDGSTHDTSARERADVDKAIRIGVDAAAWQYLMHESGLRTLMDADARTKWDEAIRAGDVPELTAANVRSTFGMLHDSRAEMFERGVIACFKALSWQHKTNLPQKFGKRIVLTYLRGSVTGGKWGSGGSLGHPNYDRCSRLDDLTRVLSVLDGKPEPDHRQGWYGRMNQCAKVGDPDAEDAYLSIKSFRNGNGHVTFRRLDLVERMNQILAKHYPNALPEPK